MKFHVIHRFKTALIRQKLTAVGIANLFVNREVGCAQFTKLATLNQSRFALKDDLQIFVVNQQGLPHRFFGSFERWAFYDAIPLGGPHETVANGDILERVAVRFECGSGDRDSKREVVKREKHRVLPGFNTINIALQLQKLSRDPPD
jgi:hypothetical protein